jgi:hypothetical protein
MQLIYSIWYPPTNLKVNHRIPHIAPIAPCMFQFFRTYFTFTLFHTTHIIINISISCTLFTFTHARLAASYQWSVFVVEKIDHIYRDAAATHCPLTCYSEFPSPPVIHRDAPHTLIYSIPKNVNIY